MLKIYQIRSVKIGEGRDQLFRDAFFQTDFGVKKTRKIQENTRKHNKRQPNFDFVRVPP